MKKEYFKFLFVFIACLMCAQAWGTSVFSISEETVEGGTRFTVSRSETMKAQLVRYRVVSLTAVEGQNFVSAVGTLTFPQGTSSKTVDVSEMIPRNSLYYSQTVLDRSYRLEVVDVNGFELAHLDHTISIGKSRQVHADDLYRYNQLYINNGDEVTVTDKGYKQAYHEFPVADFFAETAPKDYLVAIGARLRADIHLQVKEVDDGYQYIQVLANETSNFDTGAKDGNPGTINYSLYMAGFGHLPGTKCTVWADYEFPLTTASDNCGPVFLAWNYPNYFNDKGKLYTQKYAPGARESGTALLLLPTDLNSLGIRFDASGDNGDTWKAQNVKANICVLDGKNPLFLSNEVKVSAGPYNRGNTVTVTIPFDEIVKYESNTRVLNTSWGALNYVAGSGTNVLTFSGTITAPAGTVLKLNGVTGEVRDLEDYLFMNSVSMTLNDMMVTEQYYPALLENYSYFSGFTVESGSEPNTTSSSHTYDKLVDNNKDTKWCSFGQPLNVEFSSPIPIVVKGYVLTTGYDIENHRNRNPRAWTLQGKLNANDPWTTLDTRNQTNSHLPFTNKTTKEYTINNMVSSYRYFRLDITEVVGAAEADGKVWMELSELQLLGTVDANYATNLANATIKGLSQYYQYTGNAIDYPTYTVKAADGTTLVKGTHYTESFSPSTIKDVGEYSLTITKVEGSGYAGSQTCRFNVVEMLPVSATTTTWSDGCQYAVSGNVTINAARVIVNGNVTLNLLAGSTLTIPYGIQVSTGSTLTINGPGALVATAPFQCAAIGGTAGSAPDCGTIIINGGQITANLGDHGHCGIGKAKDGANPSGSVVMGWNADTDFIKAKFDIADINYAEGKDFILAEQCARATSSNLTGVCTLLPASDANLHNLEYAVIDNIQNSYYYTGEDITFAPRLRDVYNNDIVTTAYNTKLQKDGVDVNAVRDIGHYVLTYTSRNPYTGSKSATFDVVANPAPSGLYQTDYDATSVRIAWTENGVATQWKVRYSTNADFTNANNVVVSSGPTVFTLTGLTPETTYYVKVMSNPLGSSEEAQSPWSDPIRVYPTAKKWIGLGASKTNDYLPICSNASRNHTQQIYLSDEMGGAKTITSVDFYNTDNVSEIHNLKLYLVHTDKAKMTSRTDWIAEADKVFDGEVEIVRDGWTTITFDTPFIYNGVQNLALIIDERTESQDGNFLSFRAFDAEGCGLAYYSIYAFDYGMQGTLENTKNEVRFGTLPYVNLADDEDNSSVLTTSNTKTCDVHLADRTLYKDGCWNTLFLPFSLTIAESPLAGATVMKLNKQTSSFVDGTLTLNFEVEPTTLAAGTPYIIRWDKADGYEGNESDYDLVSPTFPNVTVRNEQTFSQFGNNIFRGAYAPVTLNANDQTKLFLGAGNKLYYPSETVTLGAQRAYFELDPSVHAPEHIIFNFNEPTGVTNVKRDTSGSEAIKFVRDGQLYILRNGIVYDALGKIAEGVSIHN